MCSYVHRSAASEQRKQLIIWNGFSISRINPEVEESIERLPKYNIPSRVD